MQRITHTCKKCGRQVFSKIQVIIKCPYCKEEMIRGPDFIIWDIVGDIK
jgi:predicted Zn-ribbon and HTH transcriptional regulator